MAVNPCAVIGALSNFELGLLNAINRKFAALQALAALLEQLGTTNPLPNLTSLVPVASLDLPTYALIAAACPMLNLPTPGAASLAALQAQLTAAYNSLVKQVQGHAFMAMADIEQEMAKFTSKIGFPSAPGLPMLACLTSACSSSSTATPAAIASAVSTFNSGYAASGGQVLSAAQQDSVTQADNALTTLAALGATVSTSYAEALVAATTSTGTVTTESAGTLYSGLPYVPVPLPVAITVIATGSTPAPPATTVPSSGTTYSVPFVQAL